MVAKVKSSGAGYRDTETYKNNTRTEQFFTRRHRDKKRIDLKIPPYYAKPDFIYDVTTTNQQEVSSQNPTQTISGLNNTENSIRLHSLPTSRKVTLNPGPDHQGTAPISF